MTAALDEGVTERRSAIALGRFGTAEEAALVAFLQVMERAISGAS